MMKTASLVVLLIFSTFLLKAQNNLGAFSGRILDNTNSKNVPLEAVTIKFKNESTGFQTHTITKKNGYFKIEEERGVFIFSLSKLS